MHSFLYFVSILFQTIISTVIGVCPELFTVNEQCFNCIEALLDLITVLPVVFKRTKILLSPNGRTINTLVSQCKETEVVFMSLCFFCFEAV